MIGDVADVCSAERARANCPVGQRFNDAAEMVRVATLGGHDV